MGPGASEGSAYTGTGQGKEQVYVATGRFTGGPIRVQADFGQRKDFGNIGGQDRVAWKVGAAWVYAPGSQIAAIFGNIKNKNIQTAIVIPGAAANPIAAVGSSPNANIAIVAWEHMFGQFQVIAQYAMFGKIGDLTNDPGSTDAQGFTLAGKYFLSKRTGVYASFNQIKNKENAFYDISNGGSSSVTERGSRQPRLRSAHHRRWRDAQLLSRTVQQTSDGRRKAPVFF